MNILILSATENKNSLKIKAEATKRGHKVDILSPNDFLVVFADGKTNCYVQKEHVNCSSYDAVIPRLGSITSFGVHLLRHFVTHSNIVTTAYPEGILKASDKLRTTLELNAAGIRIPKTATVRVPDNFKFLTDSVGGLPCIAKTVTGSQGNGVYIFETELQSSVTLKNLRKDNKNLIVQQFIETAEEDNRKNDIRAWVVGDRVVAAFKRLSTDSDFRSNYSISKAGEKVTLTNEEKQMAVSAAQTLSLPCAGVDIARNAKEKLKPYIIEVNSNASLTGIEKVTGVNISKYIIDWVEKVHAAKKVKTEHKILKSYQPLNDSDLYVYEFKKAIEGMLQSMGY